MWTSKPSAGHGTGKACHKRWGIRQAARLRKKERFISLLHDVSVDLLRLAFFELKRNAVPGVDGLIWQDYEADLELRLMDMDPRVQRGAYRALPSRRRYIPKPDGRQRLSEDGIVTTCVWHIARLEEGLLRLHCSKFSYVILMVVWGCLTSSYLRFLSHSTKDSAFVRRLNNDLKFSFERYVDQ